MSGDGASGHPPSASGTAPVPAVTAATPSVEIEARLRAALASDAGFPPDWAQTLEVSCSS